MGCGQEEAWVATEQFIPRYREAFPVFDIVQAQASFERGEVLCLFTDEVKRRVGYAFITDSEERLELEFTLQGPYYAYGSGRVSFPMELQPNGVHPDRRVLRCPACGQRRRRMFYTGKWACADCHGLMYRSQLVAPRIIRFERLGSLKQEIGCSCCYAGGQINSVWPGKAIKIR
jgi:hypothetical protein